MSLYYWRYVCNSVQVPETEWNLESCALVWSFYNNQALTEKWYLIGEKLLRGSKFMVKAIKVIRSNEKR